MKALIIKSSTSLLVILLIINLTQAQEYDDIYFRKSDRKKLKELHEKESPTYGRDSPLYEEIDKLGEERLSEYQKKNQSTDEIVEDAYDESVIVEKHYYYSDPSTRYYHDFDDVFWNDPYLYQGNIYDPYYDRSSDWRPGWNVSISFGNRWGRSRWRSNYWDRYSYGSYGYYNSWSYDPWYYDSYGYPPYYANRGNVIVYGNRLDESRGVTRGRRSSRNSVISSDGRNTGRSGRISDDGDSGGKGGRSGRFSKSSSTYRNTSRTDEGNVTNSRTRSSTGTYSGSSRKSSNSRSSGLYRSGSRSSKRSGSRSSSTRSSSSSRKSKSSRSSRSSRSKRDN